MAGGGGDIDLLPSPRGKNKMAKLIITTLSGRHRKEHTFNISGEIAADPVKRAQTISVKSAALLGRVINTRIEE